MVMKCAICLSRTDSIGKAVIEGWEPSFYEGLAEHGPVCPSCLEFFLEAGEAGVFEVKKRYQGFLTYSDGDYSDGSDIDAVEESAGAVRAGMEA
jgi:hypothetical protein